MKLSKEQAEKLLKLDAEMENKRKNIEENREKNWLISQKFGIPVDIVDIDVVKIGTMLGIFRDKEDKSENSLLKLLLGSEEKEINYENIPPHYSLCPQRITLDEKISHHEKYVEAQCAQFKDFVNQILSEKLISIEQTLSIGLVNSDIGEFVENVKENMEILFEFLETETNDEFFHQIHILRNSLLGCIPICKYKDIVKTHVMKCLSLQKDVNFICQHLSFVESCLVLIPGFQTKEYIVPSYLQHEQMIQNYTSNLPLKPYCIDFFVTKCCTLLILFIPIECLLKDIIGPFMNNSVGCLTCIHPNAFYVLKDVTSHGINVWVLDHKLYKFIQQIKTMYRDYYVKTFKIFYKKFFDTNEYRPNFWKISPIFETMLTSLTFLYSSKFDETLREIIRHQSVLIPTEYDAYNSFKLSSQESTELIKISLFEKPHREFIEKWPNV